MTDEVEVLFDRYYQGKPARVKQLGEERSNNEIARGVRELRTQARLTQAELAKIVGTTASVICRLEDADYEGHSWALRRRIAAALNQRDEIRFIPLPQSG